VEKLVSVVVPAYNVENYIVAALTSALSQPGARQIEVIVVDDGSTDGTSEQLKILQKAHSQGNLKIVHQANGGVSSARNVGLAHAAADYIAFLDADDLWHPDFCKIVLPLVEQQVADIIEFDVGIMNFEGRPIDRMHLVPPDATGYVPARMTAIMDFANVCQSFPVARVYRRSLWNGVKFPLGRVYEDISVIPKIYTHARSFYRIPRELYFYRRRSGSITSRATSYTVECLALCAEEALSRCSDPVLERFWSTIFDKAFRYMCLEASKVPRRDVPETALTLQRVAERYRLYAAGRTMPPRLKYQKRLFLSRRVFGIKQFVKRFVRLDH
jgi:glycosyltransferase involved in cell wall biosynthesis